MVKIKVLRCKNRKYAKRFKALQHGLQIHFGEEIQDISDIPMEEKCFDIFVNDERIYSQTNGDGKLDSGDKVARIFQIIRNALNREKAAASSNSTAVGTAKPQLEKVVS